MSAKIVLPIRVKYRNSKTMNSMSLALSIEKIEDAENVISIDCSSNMLFTLPDLNFPNLIEFNCSNNYLSSLPAINCPKLEIFDCSNNKFKLPMKIKIKGIIINI